MAVEMVKGEIRQYEQLHEAAERLVDEWAHGVDLVDPVAVIRDVLQKPKPVLVQCMMCTAVQVLPATWAAQGLECEVCGSGVGLFPYDALAAARKDRDRAAGDREAVDRLEQLTQVNMRLRRKVQLYKRILDDDGTVDSVLDESIEVCKALRIDMDNDYDMVAVARDTRKLLDQLVALLAEHVRDEGGAADVLHRIVDERKDIERSLSDLQMRIGGGWVGGSLAVGAPPYKPKTELGKRVHKVLWALVSDALKAQGIELPTEVPAVQRAPVAADAGAQALQRVEDGVRDREEVRRGRIAGGVGRTLFWALDESRKMADARWEVIAGDGGLDRFAIVGREQEQVDAEGNTRDVDVTWFLGGAMFVSPNGTEWTTVWIDNRPKPEFVTATVDADHPAAQAVADMLRGPLEVLDGGGDGPPREATPEGKGYAMVVDDEFAAMLAPELEVEFAVNIVFQADHFDAEVPEKLSEDQAEHLLLATLRIMQRAGVEPWPVVERLQAQRPAPENVEVDCSTPGCGRKVVVARGTPSPWCAACAVKDAAPDDAAPRPPVLRVVPTEAPHGAVRIPSIFKGDVEDPRLAAFGRIAEIVNLLYPVGLPDPAAPAPEWTQERAARQARIAELIGIVREIAPPGRVARDMQILGRVAGVHAPAAPPAVFKADNGREAQIAALVHALDHGWVVWRGFTADGDPDGWHLDGPNRSSTVSDTDLEAMGDALLAHVDGEFLCLPWTPWTGTPDTPATEFTRIVHPHAVELAIGEDGVAEHQCVVCYATWGEE